MLAKLSAHEFLFTRSGVSITLSLVEVTAVCDALVKTLRSVERACLLQDRVLFVVCTQRHIASDEL